jgi:hypothetical protein
MHAIHYKWDCSTKHTQQHSKNLVLEVLIKFKWYKNIVLYVYLLNYFAQFTHILFQTGIKDLDVEFTYKLDYKYYVMFLYIYLLIYLFNVGLLNHTNPFPYNTKFLLSTYFSNMFCYLNCCRPHN